jgi:hypothetical protein
MLRSVEASQGRAARDRLAASPLEFWRAAWDDANLRADSLWQCLGRLPQEDQKRFSAGFQLDAIKPPARSEG